MINESSRSKGDCDYSVGNSHNELICSVKYAAQKGLIELDRPFHDIKCDNYKDKCNLSRIYEIGVVGFLSDLRPEIEKN